MNKSKKILVIASARPVLVKEAICAARNMFDIENVDIIGSDKLTLEYQNYCSDYYKCTGEQISFKNLSENAKASLRKKGYDICLIVFNNPKRRGYERIERLVYRLKIPSVFGFATNGKMTIIKRAALIASSVKHCFSFCNHLLAIFLLGLWGLECLLLWGVFLLFGKYIGKKTVFVSHFGYIHPTARIRSYDFAKKLAGINRKTKVISLFDRGYKHDPNDLFDWQKLYINIVIFHELLFTAETIILLKPNYVFLCAIVLKKMFGKKLIFDIDDWDIKGNQLFFIDSRDVIEIMARFSDACTAPSEPLKKLLGMWNKNIYDVRTLPDIGRFSCDPSIGENESLTFFWGGMIWENEMAQNLKQMIHAFFNARQKVKDPSKIFFKIAAGGDCAGMVEQMIKGEYDHCGVEYLGWIEPDEMEAVYNTIDVGLYILWHGDKEFFASKSPTKLFEYMLMGKAIIASPIGEVNNIIKNGENGMFARNQEELTEAMIAMTSDRQLCHKLGSKAREDALEKYNLQISIDTLDNLLTKIGKC